MMLSPQFRPVALVVVLQLLVQPLVSAQVNAEKDYQRSIEDVGKKISAITRTLNSNKAELKTERDKLFETETQLSELIKAIDITQQNIASGQAKLSDLTSSLEATVATAAQNRAALNRLIVSRFKQGDKNYLKLLLNQENPYAVGRLNNYHHYFSNAFLKKLATLQQQAQEIAALEAEQVTVIESLEQEKQRQDKQKSKLSESKKARAQSVAKLSNAVTENSKKLEQLNKDRQRLDSLIKQIAAQRAELERLEKARRAQELAERAAKPPTNQKPAPRPARKPIKGGFVKQKGRLRYPVQAKRKRSFGSRLVESGMTSDGIFFDTREGQTVKSIFRGQVLFADFLKGYGLLLIIDHGDDHISLYGHNEILYKKVGDAVTTNEVVAKTGVTGGLKSPGLYFEIRKNATPVNPATWCQ